jgi:hypothetical protein
MRGMAQWVGRSWGPMLPLLARPGIDFSVMLGVNTTLQSQIDRPPESAWLRSTREHAVEHVGLQTNSGFACRCCGGARGRHSVTGGRAARRLGSTTPVRRQAACGLQRRVHFVRFGRTHRLGGGWAVLLAILGALAPAIGSARLPVADALASRVARCPCPRCGRASLVSSDRGAPGDMIQKKDNRNGCMRRARRAAATVAQCLDPHPPAIGPIKCPSREQWAHVLPAARTASRVPRSGESLRSGRL